MQTEYNFKGKLCKFKWELGTIYVKLSIFNGKRKKKKYIYIYIYKVRLH